MERKHEKNETKTKKKIKTYQNVFTGDKARNSSKNKRFFFLKHQIVSPFDILLTISIGRHEKKAHD